MRQRPYGTGHRQQWNKDTSPPQPSDLQLALAGVEVAELTVWSLRARVRGVALSPHCDMRGSGRRKLLLPISALAPVLQRGGSAFQVATGTLCITAIDTLTCFLATALVDGVGCVADILALLVAWAADFGGAVGALACSKLRGLLCAGVRVCTGHEIIVWARMSLLLAWRPSRHTPTSVTCAAQKYFHEQSLSQHRQAQSRRAA